MKTRLYPRVDKFDWANSKIENGNYDAHALQIYRKDGMFKAVYTKFFGETEKRIIRTISEMEFEKAKHLLYVLYVKARTNRECELAAQNIDWLCASF